MNKRNQTLALLIFVVSFLSIACQPATSSQDEKSIDANTIYHEVYLDFNEDSFSVHREAIKSQLLKLGELPTVQNLSLRQKEETGDSRHFELYDILLYMEFSSADKMAQYASDPKHIAVRNVITPWLTNPPVIFDTSTFQ